jgi:hypothetical protein
MRRHAFRRGDEAVASSLGTMLAILVILALLTMVTTSWAPEWTKGKEAEHMRMVESQFSSLKALLDQVTLSDNQNMVVSSPLTLGSEGVPLFSADASGNLSLLSSRSNSYNTVSVVCGAIDFERVAYGSIVYQSFNTEYIDQTFIYECGAIIIRQQEGELMTTGPSLIVQNVSGTLAISVTLLSVYSDGATYQGAGTIGVQCRLVQQKIATSAELAGETVYINVTSGAYLAWYDYFARMPSEWGVGATDYDITVNTTASSVHLELRNVSMLITDYAILGTSLDLT